MKIKYPTRGTPAGRWQTKCRTQSTHVDLSVIWQQFFPPHETPTYLIPSVTILGLHNRLVVGTWMQMLDGVRHDMCERLRCRAMLGREYKIVPSAGLLECVVHLRQRKRQKERGKVSGSARGRWNVSAYGWQLFFLTPDSASLLKLKSVAERKQISDFSINFSDAWSALRCPR